jgi:hypothetical protein
MTSQSERLRTCSKHVVPLSGCEHVLKPAARSMLAAPPSARASSVLYASPSVLYVPPPACDATPSGFGAVWRNRTGIEPGARARVELTGRLVLVPIIALSILVVVAPGSRDC